MNMNRPARLGLCLKSDSRMNGIQAIILLLAAAPPHDIAGIQSLEVRGLARAGAWRGWAVYARLTLQNVAC